VHVNVNDADKPNLFTDLLQSLHPACGEVTVLKNDPRAVLDGVVYHLGRNGTLQFTSATVADTRDIYEATSSSIMMNFIRILLEFY